MNMSASIPIENKIENKIDFNNKNLDFFSKAIPYVIETAIKNLGPEFQERLKALSNPVTLALLGVLAAGLANPVTGPVLTVALGALGFADVVNSLTSLIGGVITAKSYSDLDKSGKAGSTLMVDALTKLAGSAIGLVKHSQKLIPAISKINPELGRHIQKIINKIPKPPKITDNLKQLIRKGDLSGIKNTNDPKIINQIVDTVLKRDLYKIPEPHQDAFLSALLRQSRNNDIFQSDLKTTQQAIDKLLVNGKSGTEGPLFTLKILLTESPIDGARGVDHLLSSKNKLRIKENYERLHQFSELVAEKIGFNNDLYQKTNQMLHELSGKAFDLKSTLPVQTPQNARPDERVLITLGKPAPPWNDAWHSGKKP